MKFNFSLFIACFCSFLSYSQITGTVTDTKKEPLPFVNIYIDNTYIGTTSNEEGKYELNVNTTKEYTIVFKYLGYKTIKKTIEPKSFPYQLNIEMEEEEVSLAEVVVNANENPANRIIRATIDNRKAMLEKISTYKADFYSKGLIRIKDAPKKIFGQELGDLGGALDSTRSGIIYLSETISKIDYKYPDKLKEKIIASKVSGDDKGFSFNNAIDVDYNFYNNTVEIGNQIISPIANYAFNYYRYKLEGVFYDDNGNLINKIKVTPKRKNDRVFSGTIYIVEDHWSIYALELDVTGEQAQLTGVDVITLKQSFSFSNASNLWTLFSQSIDFKYGIFGIKGDGRFTAVYSNYNFNPEFSKKNFTNEIVSFEDNANKKDSIYWNNIRPVPLTIEESTDYVKKDSIQTVRESKTYLDSVDTVKNKFKVGDILGGYTYNNTYEGKRFNVTGLLGGYGFNTVQGFTGTIKFNYRKKYDEFKKYINFDGSLNYGFSDERLRGTIGATYKFNNTTRPFLRVSGGVKVEQFNPNLFDLEVLNSFMSLYQEKNYMKVYDKSFIEASYSQELFNGFRLGTSLSFERRAPLFNTTDQVWFPSKEREYTSNNPLDETAYGEAPFDKHRIAKLNIGVNINFDQKYLSYPDSKINIYSSKYPTLYLGYEKGFGATNSNYNFDQIKARISQYLTLGNKGNFKYYVAAGKFFNADDISFIDYQHFNGNQTHVSLLGSMLPNTFNNLPYYDLSTNKSYTEMHAEHNFKGYILGKIPLLNKLNFNLILGAHNLSTTDNKPYQEYNIGIGNIGWKTFRFLRVDYVRSYQGGFINDAFVFGLTFN
ncbi:DUF5686 and carboxypeptidase regulatory-like domain-containing protein [Pontimicrobium sp. IMCC45349]|uniref:DUF5686 and carboxypeptidase regulatory-like domain-containing protein n=1 Tax=Pontimicrobium sp. IMCC45349 TaxID=3391574 RepID=UPI0039A22BCB